MKIVMVLVSLSFLQNIDSKRNRVSVYDEIFPYDFVKNIKHYDKYFTIDNLKFEQIDDDTVLLDGYFEFVESFDPTLPIKMDLRTEYFEKSTWNEGTIRLTEGNICKDLLNPGKFWYNVTKLWTDCPPIKGSKFPIETQYLNMEIDLPSNLPSVPWKWQFLITQGVPGAEAHKFGYTLKLEFVPL